MVRDLQGQGDTERVSTNSLPTKEARRKGAFRQAIAGRGKNGLRTVRHIWRFVHLYGGGMGVGGKGKGQQTMLNT